MSAHPHSLTRLLAGFGAAAPDCVVTGLALDSRQVTPGDLFLAVRGSADHGLAHLDQALQRGASAVAWEPAPGIAEPELVIPQMAVAGLGAQVGEIAARFFARPSDALYVAGVTGTDGKTSTAHLIAQSLDALGEPCAYFGTLGFGRLAALESASHTTPDPIRLQRLLAEARDSGCRAAAMEVSSHALDQQRVAGVDFDAVVLTNVTRDHLDYHGSEEAYAVAKRRLFEPDDARALILNRDDPQGARWLARFGALRSHADRLTCYGLDGEAPAEGRYVLSRSLKLHGAGLSMRLDTSWGELAINARLLGRFNAYNLMAAAAVLLNKGVAPDRAAQVLSGCSTVPGRIEGFHGAGAQPLVVVDYAHTPKALEQILTAVRAHCRGQLWCVFGCGGDRDRGKRPLMGAVAARLADRLIVTDDNPRTESPQDIVAAILSGVPAGMPVPVIHDRALAIATATAEAGPDDVVVVAGKGHEDYQIYGCERRDFSDRSYVAQRLGMELRP